MKLLTFDAGSGPHLGALTDRGVVDLTTSDSSPLLASMQSLIEGGDEARGLAEDRIAASSSFLDPKSIRWLAPLPLPVQMRDCLGFETHLANCMESTIKLRARQAPDPVAAENELRASGQFAIPAVWYQQPIYYKGNRFAVTGPDTDVVWPRYSQLMDFELEMGCIIGTGGRDISRENAANHIFGYTIFNDFSARDAQQVEMPGMLGPAKGKDFDGANALGPVIVTSGEIGDPYALAMRARVNGETWCDGSSSTIHWKFEDMIAHVSQSETLHPGEIIGSGTVGFGCGLERLRFLSDGDVVELEIEKIGVLRNRVVRGAAG